MEEEQFETGIISLSEYKKYKEQKKSCAGCSNCVNAVMLGNGICICGKWNDGNGDTVYTMKANKPTDMYYFCEGDGYEPFEQIVKKKPVLTKHNNKGAAVNEEIK